MTSWVNLGCGPHPAPAPWHNVDVPGSTAAADQVICAGTFPFTGVERVYAGHVFEHVAWDDVTALLALIRTRMTPGGEMMVVGPDLWAALELWRTGEYSRDQLEAVLEGDDHYFGDGIEGWAGARHQWNPTPDRHLRALQAAGWDATVIEFGVDQLRGWPVVSFASAQFAIAAVAP